MFHFPLHCSHILNSSGDHCLLFLLLDIVLLFITNIYRHPQWVCVACIPGIIEAKWYTIHPHWKKVCIILILCSCMLRLYHRISFLFVISIYFNKIFRFSFFFFFSFFAEAYNRPAWWSLWEPCKGCCLRLVSNKTDKCNNCFCWLNYFLVSSF